MFGAGVAAADMTYAAIAAFGVTAVSSVLLAGSFWIKLVGSMLWWAILTTLVSKSAAMLRPPVTLWINRISGAVLVGFALYGFATLA